MEKHRNTDRTGIQTLLTQLTTVKMICGEHISEYLTRAEMLKLDLDEARKRRRGRNGKCHGVEGPACSFQEHRDCS